MEYVWSTCFVVVVRRTQRTSEVEQIDRAGRRHGTARSVEAAIRAARMRV